MPGGLMQLTAVGDQNIILNGNPKKTFFKCAYSKYTNFSLQKFRVDFDGARTLRLNESSKFTFKIPRHADLLVDSFVSVRLPNIWSPIVPPITNNANAAENTGVWIPYEFKWIDYIGVMMIEQISIRAGNFTIQEYSGDYMLSMIERDFPHEKKELFYRMIGHIPEHYDPANSGTRVNTYPNAYYSESENGSEPSIRGRELVIPLNAWFCMKTQNAFPLASLQYNELVIDITMRPIQQLFKIRDVYDSINNYPYIAPNFNVAYMQFHRFLQTPPDVALDVESYDDRRSLWNADVHLVCTYAFLSEDERRIYSLQPKEYLYKQVKEYNIKDVVGSKKIEIDSLGLISGLTFLLKRNDIHMRNEWSNRTNWPYKYIPYDISPAPTTTQNQPSNITHPVFRTHPNSSITESLHLAPGVNVNGNLTGWHTTGDFKPENKKDILEELAILFDGNYRENLLSSTVFNYIEKYTRNSGAACDGIYCYNFSLQDSPYSLQPSGAANMSKFKNIEFEIITMIPPLDPMAQTLAICDPSSGVFVGVNKPTWRLYDYTYDLTVYEERYNLVRFESGNCGLAYAT